MINAWLVTRDEKHVEIRCWVCMTEEDALTIARAVTGYWVSHYNPDDDEVDMENYEDTVYRFEYEDCFYVSVQPQIIREKGEHGNVK